MWSSWISVAIAVGGAILAWLLADERSKTRVPVMAEQLEFLRKDQIHDREQMIGLKAHEAGSIQDRLELRRSLDRLETSKASKEVVDGIKIDISTLREQMDKRFDHVERLLETHSGA